MTDRPAINVVVVAYGSPDLLTRCLDALGPGIPVLVVDNSSSERVRAVVVERGFRYLDPGRNVGFAAGVNRALKELGSGHGDVLLLNPDARVSARVVRALRDAMRAAGNERIACASPSLTRDDGSVERVDWPFPTPGRAWLEALGFGALRRARGFLIGAVLLLRSEAIDEVGDLDERFFLYAEETDWQQRAVRAGWTRLLCSHLSASHTGAGTTAEWAQREAMFHASGERYVRKWYGVSGWWIWRSGVVMGSAVRSVTGPRRDRQRARLFAYLRGPERWEQRVGRPA